LGEVEHVQRHFERGVDFFEVPGHLAGIAAWTIGSNDKGNHAGTIVAKVRFGKLPKPAAAGQGWFEKRMAGTSGPEIRYPKPERRPKSENRISHHPEQAGSQPASALVGLRISAFGLRV
jgi:hypothetical protein